MLPEWLWAIIVGSVVVGMVVYIWNTRNQGFITEVKHAEICGKTKEKVSMDIEKLSESFEKGLATQYRSIHDLLNTKFESLDDKIENKILRELKMLGNGHSRPKATSKKR